MASLGEKNEKNMKIDWNAAAAAAASTAQIFLKELRFFFYPFRLKTAFSLR